MTHVKCTLFPPLAAYTMGLQNGKSTWSFLVICQDMDIQRCSTMFGSHCSPNSCTAACSVDLYLDYFTFTENIASMAIFTEN